MRRPVAPAGALARLRRPRGFAERRLAFLALIALPAVIYVLLVAVWPIAQGVFYSVFDYNLLRPAARSFVGLDNYRAIWEDEATRHAALNTGLFTAAAVGLELVLGLALALLLWPDGRFNRVATALMLVPITITPLAVGLLFRALLNADFGLIGYWARVAGISGPHGFLGDPASALGALVLIDVWEWTPLMALILLAGLKTLPPELIEAAEVDGATYLQRLRLVALPMMLPSIFLALVLRGMDAFRVFDIVFATTKGGPNDATNVLMFQAVKQGLEFFDIGAAAAIANLMIVAIAVMALVFAGLIRRADRKVAPA